MRPPLMPLPLSYCVWGLLVSEVIVKCSRCKRKMAPSAVPNWTKTVDELKKTFPGTPDATWVCATCAQGSKASKGIHKPKAR